PDEPGPACRIRGRGLVLALRGRGLAVPLRRDLYLGPLTGGSIRRGRGAGAAAPLGISAGAAMRRIVLPLIFGLLATAILASLGFWQLRRLDEKQAQLAQIQAGMSAPPRPLPAAPDPSMKYAPVTLSGRTTGQEILVVSGS